MVVPFFYFCSKNFEIFILFFGILSFLVVDDSALTVDEEVGFLKPEVLLGMYKTLDWPPIPLKPLFKRGKSLDGFSSFIVCFVFFNEYLLLTMVVLFLLTSFSGSRLTMLVVPTHFIPNLKYKIKIYNLVPQIKRRSFVNMLLKSFKLLKLDYNSDEKCPKETGREMFWVL